MRLRKIANITEEMNDKKSRSVLVNTAEAILRISRLTLDDFEELDVIERACFLVANQIIAAEHAALIGYTSQGPMEVAEVMSESDGGDMKRKLLLERTMRESEGKNEHLATFKTGSVPR